MTASLATRKAARLVLLAGLLAMLTGCAGLGEGLGRGLLSGIQGDPDTDRRACEVSGASFEGIEPALRRQDGQGAIGDTPAAERAVVKVMMVHGIGSHFPGYSGRTVANLTTALGLDVSAPQKKTMEIPDPSNPDASLGTLTLQRLTDARREREMLIYELTWSRISDPARASLRFDTTQLHSRNRARLNQLGKIFVNDVLVDPLVYVGAGREQILTSVRQSLCWAYSTDWDGFPEHPENCGDEHPLFGSRVEQDRFFFITHSMGSRILLDALETTAEGVAAVQEFNPRASAFRAALQNQTTTVFMLANQLPLLQAGFPPVPVRGQIAEFCAPDGEFFDQRMLAKTRVVAFSDPNDLLSYSIPEDFVQYGIDSRLCPVVVNVSLNIAHATQVFRGDGFANPLTAHSEYNDDERVLGLITGGLGQADTPEVVMDRCNWMQIEEELR